MRAEPPGPEQIHNTISGSAGGVVQAGVVHGDVHLHPLSASVMPKVPQQLPLAPHGFVGRHNQLSELHGSAALVVISAVGGIGKTWLALTWAHQAADRFPDGQLFTDLRGFSPTGPPVHPADALGGFLEALGVDRDRQPTDVDRRADLFRSLLAGRRMLVVLDNAATTHQVLPLLPGTSSSTVLVTSRDHLRGLVARHGAHPVRLDVLTDAEARSLLSTGDEPSVTELIRLCGGFPLALGLIAARAATESHLPLTDIVAELRDLGLYALDSDEPSASLSTVLSWSLRRLTDQQREVFALLGIAPGPDISLPAAASLLGLSDLGTHTMLRSLADVSLVNRVPGGRFAMHDLVRAYAGSLADNQTALRRILDFYLHTAHAANKLLAPYGASLPLDPPAPGVRPRLLPDATAALAWFDAEHACLLAAQKAAAANHHYLIVWQLAWCLHTFHGRRGHHNDQLAVWRTVAATAPTDSTVNIEVHRYLGVAHAGLNQHDEAVAHLQRSITLAEQHDDQEQQAHTTVSLARAWAQRGDHGRALELARHAADLLHSTEHLVWEARALNLSGWLLALLGDHDTAHAHSQAALAVHRRHGDLDGEALALSTLGYLAHHAGRHRNALEHYEQSVERLRQAGDATNTATALEWTGQVHLALGERAEARTAWLEALELYQMQGRDLEATRVRQLLADWSD